jgi:hypothetical protein
MDEYQFILTYSTTSETLTILPDGWDRLDISFKRNETYHSVFRNFTANTFGFARIDGGGGEFIKDAYDIDSISTIISIVINKRNPQTNDYDLFLSGILDFNPSEGAGIKIERDFVYIGITDNSKLQKFTANDQVNFDLYSTKAIDDVEIQPFEFSPKNINFKPIDIYLKVDSVIKNCAGDFDIHDSGIGNNSGFTLDPKELTYKIKTTFNNEFSDRLELNETTYSRTIYRNNNDYPAYLILNSLLDNHTYEYENWVRVRRVKSDALSYAIILAIYDENSILQSYITPFYHQVYPIDYDIGTPEVYNTTVEFQVNMDMLSGLQYTIPAGHYLDLYIEFKAVNPENWTSPDNGYVETSWAKRVDTGTVVSGYENLFYFAVIEHTLGWREETSECFFPFEAFTRLIQLGTGQTGITKLFKSTFFGREWSEWLYYSTGYFGEGSLYAITSGINLRHYPTKSIKVNFRDLFKSFDVLFNLGMGYDNIDEKFYIEEKAQFYNKDYYMFDLGEVSEFTIIPMSDAFFNQLQTGIEFDGKYEDYQGAYEFNTQTEHAVNLPVKATKNLRSPYNTDSLGMEFARRASFQNHVNEDTKYDDFIYIVHTGGTNVVQGGTSLVGYPGDDSFLGIENMYNLSITSRENLIRWANVLKAGQWKRDALIKFSGSKKMNITYENQNGTIVNEFDDITEDELIGDRLFNPEIYEVKGIFNASILTILNTDAHGVITFNFEGKYYEGFLDEMKTEDYNEKATYRLIAKDSSDGASSVRIFEDGYDTLFSDGKQHQLE